MKYGQSLHHTDTVCVQSMKIVCKVKNTLFYTRVFFFQIHISSLPRFSANAEVIVKLPLLRISAFSLKIVQLK